MPAEPTPATDTTGDGTGPVPDYRPAAILWDFDGTIADTEPMWIGSEYELVERLGGQWNDEHAHHLIGSDLLVAARYMAQVAGREDVDPHDMVDWIVGRVSTMIRQADDIDWQPGARELLAALADDGMPCALVSSSWRPVLEAVLERLPEGTFAAVVPGDEVSRGKPHPDPYLQAADMLGVDPARCIVMEDSRTGAAAGNASGAWVVGIPNLVPLPHAPRRTIVRTLQGMVPSALYALPEAPHAHPEAPNGPAKDPTS